MPRRINMTVSPEMRTRITEYLRTQSGIASITLHRGASFQDGSDILSVDLSNNAALDVVKYLDRVGALQSGSVTISEPSVVISSGQARALDEEGNEAVWEEMGTLLQRESNLSMNYLLLMTLSGAVASFGLVTDTLHIVIGAMLIAPGFAPVLRIPFGVLGHKYSIEAGIKSTCAGYSLMGLGALVGMALALLLGDKTAAELPELYWASYWSKVEATGVATSLLAGIAGGVITSSRQTVFSTGVMVALALVPSMSLVAIGLGSGHLGMAWGALMRWGVEVLCVVLGGGLTLAAKRAMVHRRMRKAGSLAATGS